MIDGWISERAAENPAALAVGPRLLITKNEMASMADSLAGMLDAAEANRAAEDAERFFAQVRALVAQMAENSVRLVAAGAATPGAALEFLEDLPYRSQPMQITSDRCAKNAIGRRRTTDGMRQTLAQYRRWLFDPTV